MIKTKVIALILTTRCTLRCKKCALGVPYFKEPRHEDTDKVKEEIDAIFRIYDYVERIDVSGGEALMHPDVEEIVRYCAKFEKKFGSLRIISNGTILPKPPLLEALKELGENYGFLLDHYGEISPKAEETEELCRQYGIPYKLNKYYGKDQYCGGWIDFGDFNRRDYDAAKLGEVYHRCHTSENPCITLYDGEAYFCVRSMCGYKFGHYDISESERIDLMNMNDEESIEKNREKAVRMGTYPPAGCMYCNGFDTENSERFPAAEQI